MPHFTSWIVTARPDLLEEVRRQLEVIDFRVTETIGLNDEIFIGTAPEDAKAALQAIEGVESVEPNRTTRLA